MIEKLLFKYLIFQKSILGDLCLSSCKPSAKEADYLLDPSGILNVVCKLLPLPVTSSASLYV